MADTLKRYLEAESALTMEKARVEKRLAEISRALGGLGGSTAGQGGVELTAARKPQAKRVLKRGPAPGSGRRGNPMSLKAAVALVTRRKPLGKQEILSEIAKIGYRFATQNPIGSLNSILYGKGAFKNVKGKFRAA